MAKFHKYSFNNTMLIAMQRPDATLVTSYKNWQSMGRQVMKGEKGITIIAPAPYKKMKEKEVLDENQRPIMGTDGKPKTEQVEVTVPHFKAVTVFDIAQTSGEPIQTLAPELLTAAVQDFDSFMQAIQKISPVPIRFDEIDGNANGYYHNADKEIVIKKGLSESQTLKTAIHETAHAKLHDREIMESLGVEKDRLTKEVESESVAYCVCSSFGLDTSDYSFPYIAGWSSSREMKEMKASMDVIRKTAGEMIDQLTEELESILEEKQKAELYEKRGYLIKGMEAAGYRYDAEGSKDGKSHLVKSFLLAPIHDSFLKSVHEVICGTMLVSGGFFMWFIHIWLPFHCSFPHTVYDDMGMDISGFIVTIGMSNHQCLISRKHLLCKFQTDCLCSLAGKSIFCNIGWIVADNVVVTFDIFTFLIFVKMSICQFTFLVKRHRITVQSIHIKLFSQDASSGFIYNLFSGFFIMFKQKVINSSRVICISVFNVFYDCHSYHLPVSVPLFSIGISQ